MRKRLAIFWQFALLGNVKEVVEKCTLKLMLGSSYLAIMVFTLGCLSQLLLNPNLQEQENSLSGAAHIYGPVPLKLINQNHYHFDQVVLDYGSAFGQVEIDRLYEMSKEKVRELMLEPIPQKLHERFLMVLPIALSFAEQYQVDPFWVVSVMWVESHFDPFAQSKVRAKGLMQVLTPTGVGIAKRLGRNVSKRNLKNVIHDPSINIELGTVYLKHLLKQFDGNYVLATVAYNMGPSRVRKRLRENLSVGEDNHYLRKVRRAYFRLSKSFVDEWRQKNRPYEDSLFVDLRYTPQTVAERWIYAVWEEITTPRVALN